MTSPREILAILLASGREAGTADVAQARRVVAEYLSSLGYQVSEAPFLFSTLSPNAYPVFGAGLGWLVLIQIPLLTMPGVPGWAALAAWVVGVPALAALVMGVLLGWGGGGGKTREDANIIARRDAAPVQRWIVAHLDSKSQGLSAAWKIGTALYAGLVMTGLSVMAGARLAGPLDVDLVAFGAAAALAACGLSGRGALRGQSRGARDSGSGLLAALTAAAAEPENTGIMITGARHFGAAGARIIAEQHGPSITGVEVVDLDAIDDCGRLHVWYHSDRATGLAERLAQLLGGRVSRSRWFRGPFLACGGPLSDAGAIAVTVSRYDWHTLRRLHRPGDTAEGLAFDTAEEVGRRLGGV